MPDRFFLVLTAVLGLPLAFAIHRYVRYGRAPGSALGSPIAATLGHARATNVVFVPTAATVHRLVDATPYRAVGLEFVYEFVGSPGAGVFTFSREQARQAGRFLVDAADGLLANVPSGRVGEIQVTTPLHGEGQLTVSRTSNLGAGGEVGLTFKVFLLGSWQFHRFTLVPGEARKLGRLLADAAAMELPDVAGDPAGASAATVHSASQPR
jgi:hypothetical protein